MMKQGEQHRVRNLTGSTNDLEKYAQEVLTEMIQEGVPPTPSNFDAYFDKLLDGKPAAFRKRILKLLELEDGGEDNHHGVLEQYLKDAFGNVKKFLQHINLLYKNLRHLEHIIEKRLLETAAVADKDSLMTLLDVLKKDVQTMNKIIKKEAGELKERYESTSELILEVQDYAIHEERYGVYKKNYLLTKMRKEEKLIAEFGHESTLMMVRASDKVLSQISRPKVRHLILRTVARLLLKTSRRSDVVAHYEDEIFAILMRHTSLENAKQAAMRLKDLVGNTNFFVGDREVVLDVDIGIARISLDRSSEQTIICALHGLDIAYQQGDVCGICPHDK